MDSLSVTESVIPVAAESAGKEVDHQRWSDAHVVRVLKYIHDM